MSCRLFLSIWHYTETYNTNTDESLIDVNDFLPIKEVYKNNRYSYWLDVMSGKKAANQFGLYTPTGKVFKD